MISFRLYLYVKQLYRVTLVRVNTLSRNGLYPTHWVIFGLSSTITIVALWLSSQVHHQVQ